MAVRFARKPIQTAKVLGLDVSTKTGAVLLDSSLPELGIEGLAKELSLKPLDNGTTENRVFRASELFTTVRQLLFLHKPDLVAIEGYGYANVHTLAILVELGTMVRYACIVQETPFLDVPPTVLKKYVTGKGNTKKDQMRLAVYKKWGYEHKSDNVVDAYALSRIGFLWLRVTPPANKLEKEVLSKLRKP